MKKFLIILLTLLVILIVVRVFILSRQRTPRDEQGQTSTPVSTIISQETGQVKLIKNISAKEDLLGMTASPDEKHLYITSFDENKIYVLDTQNDEIVKEITTPVGPYGVVYLKGRNELAVSAGADQILFLDPESGAVKSSSTVGLKPLDLTKSLDEKYLFSANSMADTVSVVELATGQLIKTIGVGRSPERLTLSQDGKWLFVNNRASDDISVISVQNLSLATHFKVPGNPTALVHSSKNNALYLLDSWTNQVQILNAEDFSVEEQIAVDELPVDTLLLPSEEFLYVLSFSKNSVSVINLQEKKVENKINFSSGFLPETGLNRLYLLPSSQKLYLTNTNFGKIVVLEIQ